jgi:hypothetical protein
MQTPMQTHHVFARVLAHEDDRRRVDGGDNRVVDVVVVVPSFSHHFCRHFCRHFVIHALSSLSLSPLPCRCRRRCGARCHVASMCEHMGGSRDGENCEGRGLEHEGELYSPSSASSRHCDVDVTSWNAVAPVVALRCRVVSVVAIVLLRCCGTNRRHVSVWVVVRA